MKFNTLSLSIAALLSANAFAKVGEHDLPAMVVSADFRPALALETPISLTTIDSDTIDSRGAQHVEDILNLAPNVNVSSGASRGKYFQIRGMGLRSQFYEAPVNPSVGLIIDGIDFSRTGSAATLFDVEQVEVLRGPQGTRFGTSALAGVISLQSKQPTEELDIHFETGIADYNTRSVGLAVGGPLIENTLLGRIALHSHKSDGYIENDFLNRDNTQNRDEVSARGQLKWLVNTDLTIDLSLLHNNLDNGYDAFNFENNRNTISDEPGEDKEHSNAVALKSDWRMNDAIQLQTAWTYSKSNTDYSYDADWTYAGFPNGYVGAERFERDRENYSAEIKALSNENGRILNNSTDWVFGFYYFSQDEHADIDSPYANLETNQYETRNAALFGQLDTHLTPKLTLISGLRVEKFKANYKDSNGLSLTPDETLFGGKLGLNYQATEEHLLYASVSRGYKSGGVNNEDSLPLSEREFDTEYVWSWETGIKSLWLEGDLQTSLNFFYANRRDAQVKSSVFVGGGSFEDSTVNAGKSRNYGLEAELNWNVSKQWRVFSALGLLKAEFRDYDNPPKDFDIEGRRQANSPAYTFNFGSAYDLTPSLTLRANIEGKDEFYFSDSHNEKSGSYALTNASLEYRTGDWKVTFWGRNLFDKDYATRGFFFPNNPTTGYPEEKFLQLGEPRVVGLSVAWDY
jgi:outer membrane receptor protein involved in Fe transport